MFKSLEQPFLESLEVGQRIRVGHGMATIKGFECFDSKGFNAPLTDKIVRKDHPVYGVEYGRVIVELDEGHNWPFTGFYGEYPNYILKLNCGHLTIEKGVS